MQVINPPTGMCPWIVNRKKYNESLQLKSLNERRISDYHKRFTRWVLSLAFGWIHRLFERRHICAFTAIAHFQDNAMCIKQKSHIYKSLLQIANNNGRHRCIVAYQKRCFHPLLNEEFVGAFVTFRSLFNFRMLRISENYSTRDEIPSSSRICLVFCGNSLTVGYALTAQQHSQSSSWQ